MAIESQAQNRPLHSYDPEFKLLGGRPKPDFMLIGAAKCGTTSFSSYLPLHPQVRACIPKEPNFWSWKSCSRETYQQLFVNSQPTPQPATAQQIGGEYSTSYLLHPLAPRRIRARLPAVKIMVLLRDPVDRAYSHYVMAQRNGSEPECSFEEVIQREIEEAPIILEAHNRGFLDSNGKTTAHRTMPDGTAIHIAAHREGWPRYPLLSERELMRFYVTSYVFRSIYHDQLWRWLQLFPRQQLKIIDSSRLLCDRTAVLHEVSHFLGLQPYAFKTAELNHTWGGGRNDHNRPADYSAMSATARERLTQFFRPYNERLFNLIGERFDWG